MTYYYKELSSAGSVKMLLTYEKSKPNIANPSVMEITQEEYEALLAEIEAKMRAEEEAAQKAAEEAERQEQEVIAEAAAEEALAILTGEINENS